MDSKWFVVMPALRCFFFLWFVGWLFLVFLHMCFIYSVSEIPSETWSCFSSTFRQSNFWRGLRLGNVGIITSKHSCHLWPCWLLVSDTLHCEDEALRQEQDPQSQKDPNRAWRSVLDGPWMPPRPCSVLVTATSGSRAGYECSSPAAVPSPRAQ